MLLETHEWFLKELFAVRSIKIKLLPAIVSVFLAGVRTAQQDAGPYQPTRPIGRKPHTNLPYHCSFAHF